MRTMQLKPMPESKVIGRECRHLTYKVSDTKQHDAVFVKEWLYTEDGGCHPNIRMVEDMERKFWVTKPGRRDYTEKLQWEKLDNCTEYSCREMDLPRRLDKALGDYGAVKNPKFLLKSPYVYGCNIPVTALIKRGYSEKYPDFISQAAKVAACDTETDVLHGTGEINMCSLTFKERVLFVANRHFYNGDSDSVICKTILEMADKLIGDVIKERNINIDIVLVDTSAEIVIKILECCHLWAPDFVEFWNMSFDIEKMIYCLEKHGHDPKYYFSDPDIPDDYKFFKFRLGPSIKTTHEGRVTSINPEQRWHVVECPASFFMVDGMTSYYRLRIGAGNEDSYALDYILNKNLKIKKLKIEEIDHLTGIDWHKEMQRHYKYEYSVYNIFDCIAVEMLDEKTSDISVKFSAQSTNSDYTDFRSGPTKIADDMHFHCLTNGYVVGVTDGDAKVPDDDHYMVSRDWIITLDASLSIGMGVDFLTGDGVYV